MRSNSLTLETLILILLYIYLINSEEGQTAVSNKQRFSGPINVVATTNMLSVTIALQASWE